MTDAAAIDTDRLPTQARRLARIIGTPGLLRLLRAFGGRRIRLPIRAHDARLSLRCVLTDAEIDALANSDLAGERIDVPKMDKIVQQWRDAELRADAAERSVDELCREYGLSRRRVIDICAAVPPPPADDARTDDLFRGPL